MDDLIILAAIVLILWMVSDNRPGPPGHSSNGPAPFSPEELNRSL